MRVYHRLDIVGAEHIPHSGPFVIIANHCSHLDVMVLTAALPRAVRPSTYPVAAGDVFFEKTPVTIFAAGLLNALPMWRKSSAVRHALGDLRSRLIEEPCGLILFPEGRRVRGPVMDPFKAGLGMIVAGTEALVIPCHIEGALNAMPPGSRLPRPKKLRLRVGPPLRFDRVSNDRQGWDFIASSAQDAVRNLA